MNEILQTFSLSNQYSIKIEKFEVFAPAPQTGFIEIKQAILYDGDGDYAFEGDQVDLNANNITLANNVINEYFDSPRPTITEQSSPPPPPPEPAPNPAPPNKGPGVYILSNGYKIEIKEIKNALQGNGLQGELTSPEGALLTKGPIVKAVISSRDSTGNFQAFDNPDYNNDAIVADLITEYQPQGQTQDPGNWNNTPTVVEVQGPPPPVPPVEREYTLTGRVSEAETQRGLQGVEVSIETQILQDTPPSSPDNSQVTVPESATNQYEYRGSLNNDTIFVEVIPNNPKFPSSTYRFDTVTFTIEEAIADTKEKADGGYLDNRWSDEYRTNGSIIYPKTGTIIEGALPPPPPPQTPPPPSLQPKTFTTKTDDQGNYSLTFIIRTEEKQPDVYTVVEQPPLKFVKEGYGESSTPPYLGDKTVKTQQRLVEMSSSKKDLSKQATAYKNSAGDAIKDLKNQVPKNKGEFAKKLILKKVKEIINRLIPVIIAMVAAFGISKLKEFIEGKLKNAGQCPPKDKIQKILNKRNNIVKILNNIYDTINIIVIALGVFNGLIELFKIIKSTTVNLPIPQAIGVPPAKDFGGLISAQPISSTTKAADKAAKFEKQIELYQQISLTILAYLIVLRAALKAAIDILNALDKKLEECLEEIENEEKSNLETDSVLSTEGITKEDLERGDQINRAKKLDLGIFNSTNRGISQDLLDALKTLEDNGSITGSDGSTTGGDGGGPLTKTVNGFTLSVQEDNQLVGTLKRRYAVAKNSDGLIVLRGEKSFSASDQILIDELEFYIKQNNLKAN